MTAAGRRQEPCSPAAQRLRHLIPELAEPVLREIGLLVQPIPFFERLERFRARQRALAVECSAYLAVLEQGAASRVVRTYAFADELCREVLRSLWPELPADGEWALRTLSAAGVLLDHLLDEEHADLSRLDPVRAWVSAQTSAGSLLNDSGPPSATGGLGALVAMLRDLLADCRGRAQDSVVFEDLVKDLLRLFDVEALSVNLALDAPPDEGVRAVMRQKSAGPSWAGFRACALGTRLGPGEMEQYRKLCDAMGEIMWILDDLADLEEDYLRRVWNRALWQLYDAVGEDRFRTASRSSTGMFDLVLETGVVVDELREIENRVALLESYAGERAGGQIRNTLAFWATAWLGVYA